jgi:hypothetical protein
MMASESETLTREEFASCLQSAIRPLCLPPGGNISALQNIHLYIERAIHLLGGA